ncbi:cytochrome P450 [Halorarius litoreus]|uniref:cytochrome P450 n=1 Tax=Halorarius litoreus TaxID=2962676 RepID=UPI0020CD2BBD|nr:cytochrome P450 [Halorarius litoreus]
MSQTDERGEAGGEKPWIPHEIASREGQLDPYPFFKEIRDEAPLRYDPRRDTYDVVGYDAVVESITQHERFTRRNTSYINGSLLSTDEPIHSELRGMAQDYFQPGFLKEVYEPKIKARVDELLDRALQGDDHIDFVEEFAKPLPILIIAELLNVPSEKMETFRKWSATLATAPSENSPEAFAALEEKQATAMGELQELFDAEIDRREASPTEDIIMNHIRGERDSELVDRSNVLANLSMLLIAGNVTTTQYLANAVWTFEEEDVIDELQSGEIPLMDALKEVLRYRSPVMPGKRIATSDTEIAGVRIEEGQRVVGWLSAANRDPDVFENPDQFDPFREYTKEPIPFGKGIHYCLGAPLADMEARVFFEKFLDRVDDWEVATDEIDPFVSSEIYGPRRLPIRVVS